MGEATERGAGRQNMGCSGSKSVSNRVIPMPVDADADDTTAVALNQAKKAAWGDALSKTDMTDEERSNNTTPPRSAATGGDCPTEEPCALSQTVLDRALARATHSPVKQEVEDTTSPVILLSPAPTTLHGSCLSPIKMAAAAKLEEAAARQQSSVDPDENGRFSMLDEGKDHPLALQEPPSLGSTQEPPSLGSTLDSTVGVVWGAK